MLCAFASFVSEWLLRAYGSARKWVGNRVRNRTEKTMQGPFGIRPTIPELHTYRLSNEEEKHLLDHCYFEATATSSRVYPILSKRSQNGCFNSILILLIPKLKPDDKVKCRRVQACWRGQRKMWPSVQINSHNLQCLLKRMLIVLWI